MKGKRQVNKCVLIESLTISLSLSRFSHSVSKSRRVEEPKSITSIVSGRAIEMNPHTFFDITVLYFLFP